MAERLVNGSDPVRTAPSERRVADETGRERLLRAGIEAFGTTPYDRVAMADVARRAGVAEGLPFHHFRSKHGFYVEVVRHISGLMGEVQGRDAAVTPREAIALRLRRHIAWMERHPYALLIGAPGNDLDVRAIVDGARNEGADAVIALLGVRRARPALRLAVRGWVGMIDTTLSDWLANGRDLSHERLVEMLTAALEGAVAAALTVDARIRVDPLLPADGKAPAKPVSRRSR